jgi:F-box/leucine-rich repeat protein 7
MFFHEELIQKVKLFELGEPSFILAIVRYLKPKLYMAKDFIIRQDEYAEDMHFVRTGNVEVLATDGETIIAYLDEGAYFGEIGILIQDCRSVGIRCLTAVLTSSIGKNDMLTILKNFPDHSNYLHKVAEQRLLTTHRKDID